MRVKKAQAIKDAEIAYALEEGREEEKIEIALNLLEEGLPVDLIAKTTGLSVEQVKQLRNK